MAWHRRFEDWDEMNAGTRAGDSYVQRTPTAAHRAEIAEHMLREIAMPSVDADDPPARRPTEGDDRLALALRLAEAERQLSRP